LLDTACEGDATGVLLEVDDAVGGRLDIEEATTDVEKLTTGLEELTAVCLHCPKSD
jgi:hypothetical protein